MNQRKQNWLVALLLGLTLNLMLSGIACAAETNLPNNINIDFDKAGLPAQVIGGTALSIIGILGVSWPLLIIAAILYYRYRRDALVHRTLAVMIEKGASIPPELLHPQTQPKHRSDLRRGFTLLGFGIGIIVCFVVLQSKYWGTGFIPMLIGLGYIYAYVIEKKQQPK